MCTKEEKFNVNIMRYIRWCDGQEGNGRTYCCIKKSKKENESRVFVFMCGKPTKFFVRVASNTVIQLEHCKNGHCNDIQVNSAFFVLDACPSVHMF